MKKNISVFLMVIAYQGLVATCPADVLPPPVNQKLGCPDSVFNNLIQSECRYCHENAEITSIANIPVRHHLLVGLPYVEYSVAPLPENSVDGTYQCTVCHEQVWLPPGIIDYTIHRDCNACHVQMGGSVHHQVAKAQNGNCLACHGSFVENPSPPGVTPPWIPTVPVSMVTPWPSGKTNAGPNGEGNCDFCHNSGVVSAPEYVGLFGPVDPVAINSQTHHNTGFGFDESKCGWCHDFGVPASDAIRRCQNCHSMETLHNIQADSPAEDNLGSIQPNMEDPGWGHTGSQDDCFGCHGFQGAAETVIGSTPITPTIKACGDYVVTEGIENRIVLRGESFKDASGFFSTIELETAEGVSLRVKSRVVDNKRIAIFLPGELPSGNYGIRVRKGGKYSNRAHLAVVPPVSITNVAATTDQVVITGENFGSRPEGTEQNIHVTVNGAPVDVVSWTQDTIVTSLVPVSTTDDVTVHALFGSASTIDSNIKDKSKKY